MNTFLLLFLFMAAKVKQIDSTVGYSALHPETGKRISVRGGEAFPMGSVYKFPIAISVLRRFDDGRLKRDAIVNVTRFSPGHSPLRDEANGKPIRVTTQRLLELMLRDSDNTACDVLIDLAGGPAVITREIATSGIRVDRRELDIADDIAKLGRQRYFTDARDTATPDAMVNYLTKFWNRRLGLSKESHAWAVRLMTETKTGPKRIVAALPKGATLAHKTGTMPGTVNDVGVITTPDGQHIAVAIFTKAGVTSTTEQREAALREITREVYAKLTK